MFEQEDIHQFSANENKTLQLIIEGSPGDEMVKVLDCDPRSMRYYAYFRTNALRKCIILLKPPPMG